MQEFLEMGGYAFFVWMSYGLTFLVLAINWLKPVLSEAQVKRAIAKKLMQEADNASRS